MIPRSKLHAGFLLNVAGMVLPLAAALATVPLYIAEIGEARYGILAVVWLLLGYFGFLDLGLSRASANALSRLGHASNAERAPVLMTSLYLNAGLGLIGGVVMFVAAGALTARFAHLSAELAAEVDQALPWIAAMLPVALVSGVGSGAIESRERFLAANVLATFGGVLGQVAPVVCAMMIGPSLAVVIPAAFVARAVSTAAIWAYVLRTERPLSFGSFDTGRVRELIGYGAWISVTSLISPLLASLDQFLIGALLGPAAIAHYAVPMSLANRSSMVAAALSKTLFPRLSRLPPFEATLLTSQAVVTIGYGFAAVCGPAIIASGSALRLWVGAEFAAHSAPVAAILLLGAWANGIALMPYTLLQGQGRPDLPAKIHAVELLPFCAILWFLTAQWGLSGAAAAWALRTSVDGLLLLRIAGLWQRSLLRLVPAVLFMAGCWLLSATVAMPLGPTMAATAAAALTGVILALFLDPVTRRAWAGIPSKFGKLGRGVWTPAKHDAGS